MIFCSMVYSSHVFQYVVKPDTLLYLAQEFSITRCAYPFPFYHAAHLYLYALYSIHKLIFGPVRSPFKYYLITWLTFLLFAHRIIARSGLRGQMNKPLDIEINLTNALQFASPTSDDKTRQSYHVCYTCLAYQLILHDF